MGTTLTGTTPQDTYDSLIKVTDNGPLSGSLKVLTDGLGNNSTLSLSTTAASIAGTLAVTGNATFDTNTLFVDAAANEVGIGTITPNAVLNVIGEISQGDYSTATNSVFSQRSSNAIFSIATTGTTGAAGIDIAYSWANGGQGPLTFSRAAGEVMRLSSDGYMRMAASTGGIQFNGDTAAANALDDYEEGTFTPSLQGITGTITYSTQTGSYTKIGNVVNVRFRIALASYSSTAGLNPFVNLPFTSANVADQFNNSALFLENTTYVGQSFAWINPNNAQFFPASIATGGVFTHINNLAYTSTTTITGNITYFTA